MEKKIADEIMRSSLSGQLDTDLKAFKDLFAAPRNADFISHSFSIGGFSAALIYMEGMASNQVLNENILEPCLYASVPESVEPRQRAEYLEKHMLNIADTILSDLMSELCQAVLDGKSVLLVDGCAQAVIMETRGYEKRSVGRPENETVLIGPQQGFIENLRTNVTLIRRIVRTPMLCTEMITVGKKIHSKVALVYIRGVANEKTLKELRRRMEGINADYVPDSGHLQSLIEDSPMLMIPQMLQTERPDRAAYCISDGQIAIMMDNSPYALIAPITVFHLIHAADDSYMRWQYATFTRFLRISGLLLSLFLPGTYVALVTFHPQIIPLDLLTSIAETRARVPFPLLVETLILEFAFFMINEAGTRMPHQIGSALGIVGGLILGQAAVSADIISPILVIIVAFSGLGNYAAPVYSMTLTLEILRLGVLLIGAALGLYGIALIGFVYLCILCGAHSVGVPMVAPFAPYRPHNQDLLIRMPTWAQKRILFMAAKTSWMKANGPHENMRKWSEKKEK